MAKMNVINNISPNLTINPGDTTDSYLQFSINNTDEWRIGGDATDDSYRISQGSALGTNDVLNIDANGIVLTPLQSLAFNKLNEEADVTGDGTDHSIGSVTASTAIVDQNSDMTEGNGSGTPAIFTAPVDGLYELFISMNWNGNPVSTIIVFIVTSNRTYRVFNSPMRGKVTNFYGGQARLSCTNTVIADMDASDTAVFHYQGSGGVKNSSVKNFKIGATLLV